MLKLKNSQGYSLSVVLVLMVVFGVLTSSILFTVSIKTKITNKDVVSSFEKRELDKEMYEYLNSFVLTSEFPLPSDDSFKVEQIEENTYIITLTNDSHKYFKTLTIKITSSSNTYVIHSWGYL